MVDRRRLCLPLLLPLFVLAACIGCGRSTSDEKVLYLPVPSDGPKSMDPAVGATVYDNMCVSQVYEPLLQYKYLVRPLELTPLLLEEMPTVSEDGKTYRFKLRKGVRFHDDPCFPGGKGRELVSSDVFYSWKRLADNDVSLKNWWLIENTIVGLDDYRDEQNASETFDYEAPVEGMRIINEHQFEVELVEPVQRFVWTLAMFQTAVVPREAVEKYGSRFARHPVGTGPFVMAEADWTPQKSMILKRNPTFREEFFPEEHMPEDEALGLHLAAGTKVPICDRIRYTFFVEEQPMWLQFRSGKLDVSRVPKDNFVEAFNKRTKRLKPGFQKQGIVAHGVPLLDFIFYGFNMEDELLGGYDEKSRSLRQAISLSLDWEERNDAFYNNLCVIYDGMIPPGLDGFPPGGQGPVSFRGPDREQAKALLAAAGFPDGKGLPTIDYYASIEGPGKEMAEVTARQLAEVGIKINPRLDVFSSFMESVDNRKAQFFAFAWHSDYPDPENNLALFYGPNESPGANHFNYKNSEFDAMYEKIRIMPPSPERTAMCEKMRDMVIVDSAFAGSMARTRYYLVNPWLKNCKPTEDFWTWYKYLDVDESLRR